MLKPPKLNIEIEESKDFKEDFNESIINLEDKPDRPPLAISIGYDEKAYGGVHYPLRFGTYGNISMITGEAKSRKSFVKSLIEACAIGGKSNNYTGSIDIVGHDIIGKYVVSIDTEQGDYDAWLNGIRVPKMVGSMYGKYIICKWRKKSIRERRSMLKWLFEESEYKDNLGLVVLDGFVDFVNDFNNLTECTEFTQELMKYTDISKCHLMGVLHVNRNSEKVRGHLGSKIGEKCETIILVKNMGEYSIVKQKIGRGKHFEDFTIRIDDEWLPYISEDETQTQEIQLS